MRKKRERESKLYREDFKKTFEKKEIDEEGEGSGFNAVSLARRQTNDLSPRGHRITPITV